ncbi:hypothetical protein D3C76_1102230 [compost metagenome]
MVRNIGDHFLQFGEIDDVVAFDKQAGTRRQQAVEPGPGHQLVQIAVIFQRLMADDRIHARRTVVQIPPGAVRATRRHIDKGQVWFRQVRRNLRVHQRHFTRQRFKRGVQLTGQNTDILRAGGNAEVVTTGKADQVTVALHHGIEQLVVRFTHLIDLPVGAVIEHRQTLFVPSPLFD